MAQLAAIDFNACTLVGKGWRASARGPVDAHPMLNTLAHTGEKARDIYTQPWRRLVSEPYARSSKGNSASSKISPCSYGGSNASCAPQALPRSIAARTGRSCGGPATPTAPRCEPRHASHANDERCHAKTGVAWHGMQHCTVDHTQAHTRRAILRTARGVEALSQPSPLPLRVCPLVRLLCSSALCASSSLSLSLSSLPSPAPTLQAPPARRQLRATRMHHIAKRWARAARAVTKSWRGSSGGRESLQGPGNVGDDVTGGREPRVVTKRLALGGRESPKVTKKLVLNLAMDGRPRRGWC